MAREFPISNGKLLTDLDANGHKILNLEGGGGGGTTDYNNLKNIPKINGVELSGNKTAKDLGLVSTEDLDVKRDKTDNIASKDETMFSEWSTHPDYPNHRLTWMPLVEYSGDEGWALVDPDGIQWAIDDDNNRNPEATSLTVEVRKYDKETGEVESLAGYTATRTKTILTKSGEPYVTPAGVKNIAIPKYDFADAEIVDGVLTVAPYTNAKLVSDGTAFTVAVGEGDDKTRDCVLRVEVPEGTTAPTITWPDAFSPRTDAETDMSCEAGTNVYWITEYASGQFVVARWHKEVSA